MTGIYWSSSLCHRRKGRSCLANGKGRKGLRAAFLSSKDRRKRERVEWTAPDGETYEVEIVEPTSKQRGQIRRAAMKMKGDEIEFDQTALEVWAVIMCAHDPQTGEPVFDAADYEALLEVGSRQLDVLARPAMRYLGNSPEVEAKN